jgi:capsid protein
MAFEQLRAGIAMLLDEIAANPTNAHELQEQLREKVTEMQALGLQPPADLVGLEEYLEADLDRPEGEGEGESGGESGGEEAATAPEEPGA